MNLFPLEILESSFLESEGFVSRQVGFCLQWCLDNMFPVPERKFTYTVIDNTQINMMLNSNDVSEYLKIGPNGLGARCDASSFESGKNIICNVFFNISHFQSVAPTQSAPELGITRCCSSPAA